MTHIKLIAWNEEERAFITKPEDIPIYYESDNGFHSGEVNPVLGDWIVFKLFLFIGMKDCKGKDIYDGHIVKCTDEDGSETTHQIKYHGTYGYPAFDIDPPNIDTTSNGISYFHEHGEIEIIGHKCTHPELLR